MPFKGPGMGLFPTNEGARPITPHRYKYRDFKREHLHTLDDKPLIGVSTACKILDKSGLTWWASGEAMKNFGWIHASKDDKGNRLTTKEALAARWIQCLEAARFVYESIRTAMTLEQYALLLQTGYKAHDTCKKEKAETGKDMHSLLEEFVKARMAGHDPLFIDPSIVPFVKWADENVREFLFSELHCFSEVLWCGGIADFGYIDKEGQTVLGDFKSSEKAYWNQWVQVGGYHTLIEENGGFTKEGAKILEAQSFNYHAIFAERAGLDKPFFNREVGRTRRAFAYCANLWREKVWFEETFK